MKKLILFSTLCVFAFSTKAQELNFEETVKYIKDKIECCLTSKGSIEIKKNGLVTRFGENGKAQATFNLFDLEKGSDSGDDDLKIYGVGLTSDGVGFKVSRNVTNVIQFHSKEDNLRVVKAFKRLLVVCTKEKDPFDK